MRTIGDINEIKRVMHQIRDLYKRGIITFDELSDIAEILFRG